MPKALVEIGAKPILWHVIQIYAAQGFDRFVLLTGYKGEMIESYVAETGWPDGVHVKTLDTGLDTPTGGRVHRAAEEIAGERFCLTYADGVADVDLNAVLGAHIEHGATGTVTVVRPELQFGVAELEGDLVRGFMEKPRSEHWVNGGFFCFEPSFLDYVRDDIVLEQEPLVRLAGERGLHAYRHEGFWDCMDTYKDAVLLNDLWADGEAPWKVWR